MGQILERLFSSGATEPADTLELCRWLAARLAAGEEEVRDVYHETQAQLTPAERRRLSRSRGRRRTNT